MTSIPYYNPIYGTPTPEHWEKVLLSQKEVEQLSERDVAIQFESEILSGFICTAFIEDVNAIIDIVPSSPRERSVKEHICASQGIKYISYARQKTIERTISECQRIFRDLNLFFRADSAADIQTARQIYDRASGNS